MVNDTLGNYLEKVGKELDEISFMNPSRNNSDESWKFRLRETVIQNLGFYDSNLLTLGTSFDEVRNLFKDDYEIIDIQSVLLPGKDVPSLMHSGQAFLIFRQILKEEGRLEYLVNNLDSIPNWTMFDCINSQFKAVNGAYLRAKKHDFYCEYSSFFDVLGKYEP